MNFQGLLERQADFLLEEHVWWIAGDAGAIFKDATDFPDNSCLSMHHFRSRTKILLGKLLGKMPEGHAPINTCLQN